MPDIQQQKKKKNVLSKNTYSLWIIGDIATLRKHEPWRSLIEGAKRRGSVMAAEEHQIGQLGTYTHVGNF